MFYANHSSSAGFFVSLNNSLEPVESVTRGEHDVTVVHTLKRVRVNNIAQALLQSASCRSLQ